MRIRLPLLLLFLLLGDPLDAQSSGWAPEVLPATLLLIRHAETAPDGTPDPPLSEAGRRRVASLVAALAAVPLAGVHSTPLRRTRETAAAVAAAHGLEVREYDPAELEALASRLIVEGGTHLVVGHSNTTPILARTLGGDPGTPIAENEHGRLYVVVSGAGGEPSRTLQLRLPPG